MRRVGPSVPLAAALAVAYLVLNPPSADLAAATYRTWLFHHAGFALFDTGWYGGHHLPAYSVLFAPLAGLLGPRLVGALAAVAATWCFERVVLTLEPARAGARAATLWFAVAVTASLFSNRLTFTLGLALALGATLALVRARLVLAGVLGALTALGSPVAAVFLVLALVTWGWQARRPWATLALLAATLAPVAALALLFPEGGDFPFAASAFWPALAATLAVLAVVWRTEIALRGAVALYALALVASAAVSGPMGGNATRLGALLAGPLAALVLWPQRRRLLLALVPFLLYWQLQTPADDWSRAAADPSVKAPFYDGMLRFLATQPGGPMRIEVPFTDNHWESARIPVGSDGEISLARGWERQLDRKVNPLFYDHRPLTAERYRSWLADNAVRFVALPRAPIDYSAAAEAALVRRVGTRGSFLRPVYGDAHWRVFAVAPATPLASEGARVTRVDVDAVDLVAPRAGRIVLRVRFTPYWHLDPGEGCVAPAGAWTALTLRRPGPAHLRIAFGLGRVRATSPRCT